MMCLQIVFKALLVFSISHITFSNSPPLVNFGPSSGTVLVQENFRIGDVLFSITASDPDNQPLTFSMVNAETTSLVYLSQPNQTNNIWKVDVLLKSQLDRDRSPNTRTLVFSVTDGQLPIQGRVSLTIRDVNDNPPMFTNLPYRISLPENSDINRTVFTATAFDVDDGLGGAILFFMTAQEGSNEYNTTFVLANENYGNIELRRHLDYERQTYYQYQIFAKDRGSSRCPGPTCLCSNITEPNVNCAGEPAIFTVIVTDVQDTPPFFSGLPYLASVNENEDIGYLAFTVIAHDGDQGVPNEITYSIADNDHFIVNSTTGEITLKSSLNADVLGGQNVILSVTATERVKPGQLQTGEISQTAVVSIVVLDVNDNAPMFTEPIYTSTIQRNTPRGVQLIFDNIIQVTDIDQYKNNQFTLSLEKDGHPYPALETLPQNGTVVSGMTTVAILVRDSSLLQNDRNQIVTFQIVARQVNTAPHYVTRATVTLTIDEQQWSGGCQEIIG